MKKTLTVLFAAVLLIACIYTLSTQADAATVASGTCGTNLTWTLDDAGTLTIAGTGAMINYSYYSQAPWCDYRSSIKAVIIGDGVTTICDCAFYNFDILTSVNIGNNVTSIGSRAFYSCGSLTSIALPGSVKSIGDRAFQYCAALNSVSIPAGITAISYETFYECSSLTSVKIPKGVTTIGSKAFYGCRRLISATIPNSVTSIGDSAFSGCTVLASITIPDSVTAIGNYAFTDCTSLTTVTIPAGVTTIGNRPFSWCLRLRGILVSKSNPNYSSDESGVLFNKNKTLLIHAPGAITEYTVPNSVTAIDDYAFIGCGSLTSVTIPDSVTTIGQGAFSGCSAMESITVPFIGNKKGASGDRYPFGYIFGTSAYSGGVKTKQYYGSINGGLTSKEYYIPSSLKSVTVTGDTIVPGAFSNCSNLTAVTIGDGVTAVGRVAFSGCSNLAVVTIPNSVTTIGDKAFYDCSSLTLVTFPDSVTTIGSQAFQSCSKLTSVTMPDCVTSIGNSAFLYCSKLNNVYYSGNSTQWQAIQIGDNNEALTEATIHYNHIHDYSLIPPVIVAATCAEIGYAEYTCAYGDSYRETLPALGHDFVTGDTVIAPTCKEDGYTEVTCSRCNTTDKTDVVPSLGHDYSGTETVITPTCTEDGYTNISCIRCDTTVKTDVVSPLGHDYSSAQTVVAPTCTEEGYTNASCIRCDAVGTTNVVSPLGHDYSGAQTVVAPTCTDEGYTNTSCIRCDATVKTDVVSSLGHKMILVPAVSPTCTEEGNSVGTQCERCQMYGIQPELLPALNHSFTDYKSNGDATCTEDGTETAKCDRCDETDTRTEKGSAKGHDYDSVVTASTCTEKGYTTHTCHCGNTYTDSVTDPLGHSFTDYKSNSDATCTEDGTETAKCDHCDETDTRTEEGSAKGHSYTDSVCTVCGVRTYTPGDLDGVEGVNEDDVIYLLQHLLMPEDFSVNQSVDYDKNNVVDEDDVIYLLQHLLMPEEFPLS